MRISELSVEHQNVFWLWFYLELLIPTIIVSLQYILAIMSKLGSPFVLAFADADLLVVSAIFFLSATIALLLSPVKQVHTLAIHSAVAAFITGIVFAILRTMYFGTLIPKEISSNTDIDLSLALAWISISIFILTVLIIWLIKSKHIRLEVRAER